MASPNFWESALSVDKQVYRLTPRLSTQVGRMIENSRIPTNSLIGNKVPPAVDLYLLPALTISHRRRASKYARMNGCKSPSTTRSTSPTSVLVRWSLIMR